MSDLPTRHCTFCGRSREEVRVLIVSEVEANICDACVLICVNTLWRELPKEPSIRSAGSET